MFPVICKKTLGIWHVGLWGQSVSSNHGTNVSASRCVLLISKSNTDLNVCGSEGFPVRVMNSISPLSYRTSRPWHFDPSDHPLRPRSQLRRENPGWIKRQPQAEPAQEPPAQSKAITEKIATFSTASAMSRHSQRQRLITANAPSPST